MPIRHQFRGGRLTSAIMAACKSIIVITPVSCDDAGRASATKQRHRVQAVTRTRSCRAVHIALISLRDASRKYRQVSAEAVDRLAGEAAGGEAQAREAEIRARRDIAWPALIKLSSSRPASRRPSAIAVSPAGINAPTSRDNQTCGGRSSAASQRSASF